MKDSLVDLAFFGVKLEEDSIDVASRLDDLWFTWLVKVDVVLSEGLHKLLLVPHELEASQELTQAELLDHLNDVSLDGETLHSFLIERVTLSSSLEAPSVFEAAANFREEEVCPGLHV